ncbi:MAG: sugar ABC transporter permease [Lachnospiraceae bacterium]|nr:sugar ABC transporter permease [Lachnospiraceae bacterium]
MAKRAKRLPGRRRIGRYAVAYALILPALLSNLVFDWYPMLQGIVMSFFRWDGFREPEFVGMRNFGEILSDSVFWVSVKNMLFFFVMGLILMIPTMIASIVLFRLKNKRSQYIYRILFCIPMVVPYLVTLLMWQFMYNPQYGFFNQLLKGLGLEHLTQTWLGNPDLARWCVVFMGFPFISTNAALIYLGGLQSIDASIWEAAALDGITSLKRLFYLELPLIRGQFKLNLIGALVGGITGYTTQLVVTKGGPGFETLVPGLYMYNKAFGAKQYGYASAVGLLLFVISGIISLATLKFLRSDES